MLLAVDVGNTNIVFGIFKGDRLLHNWRISTKKNRTIDEYGLLFQQIIKSSNLDPKDIDDIILSSVVPPLMDTLPSMFKRYFKVDPIIVDLDIETGIKIRYDDPKEVGADRIVNATAAYRKYGGPLIIVDFGTAITFDSISKEGDYLGGAITPGITISTDALFSRTSKLPKVELIKPDRVIGKNTVNSMQAGIVYGYIGLIDYIIKEMLKEMEGEGRKVGIVATGGFAKLIASESRYIEKIDVFLTLDGLKIIYDKNK